MSSSLGHIYSCYSDLYIPNKRCSFYWGANQCFSFQCGFWNLLYMGIIEPVHSKSSLTKGMVDIYVAWGCVPASKPHIPADPSFQGLQGTMPSFWAKFSVLLMDRLHGPLIFQGRHPCHSVFLVRLQIGKIKFKNATCNMTLFVYETISSRQRRQTIRVKITPPPS